MKKFWTDSFYIKLMKFYNHMILGILFYLFSIPIVTIGASSSALYATYLELGDDNFINVKKIFFNKFKKYLKKSVQLFFLFLLISSVLVILVLFAKIKKYPVFIFPLFFLLSLVLLLNYLNYFNLVSTDNSNLIEVFSSSFTMLNKNTFVVIAIFTINLILLLIPIYLPKLGLVLILFIPSFIGTFKLRFLKEKT